MSVRRAATTLLAAAAAALALAPAAVAQEDGGDRTPEFETSDNLELVAHHWFPEGSDMMFQRREGLQTLDGRRIKGTRDYLFAGADGSSSPDDGAIEVFDVTDPENAILLADVQCAGYHAEIVVHENLLFQGIDSARSNTGCDEESAEKFDPDGNDVAGEEGFRVYDITDPARPVVIDFILPDELGGAGVHNATAVPWADLLYIASSDFTTPSPRFGFIDLTDPELTVTMTPMPPDDKGFPAPAACHDIGLDPERELAFCAAVEQTYIWDISDPTAPETIATIHNPAITIHHGARLAPDGTTLVLNDELAGAAFSPGCFGTESAGLIGALWFYDLTEPESPSLMGSYSTDEAKFSTLCTSHFYNFVPGTTFLVVGWYESGMIAVDYAEPSAPTTHAFLRPEGGASFWSTYYWHGYLYGLSRTTASEDETEPNGGGLWIAKVDDIGDEDPAPEDEGTSWARWTATTPPARAPARGVRGT
ncbi:MAG: LVIVD repeat-containing protein, partial [Nitriliruptorales bacterium]